MTRGGLICLLLLVVPACSRDATGPAQPSVRMAAAEGTGQFGLARATLELALSVHVTDATTGAPVKDVSVSWRVVAGSGASVSALSAKTDDIGIASAQLTLGSETGAYRVEATAPRLVGDPASFEARAIVQPLLQAVSPTVAPAGSTVALTGANFSASAADHTVLFGGLRGRVLSATTTRLDVEVPRCALTRDVQVKVALGSVATSALPVRTVALQVPVLSLARGEARTLTDPADLECVALQGVAANAEYLIIPQNRAQRVGYPARLELNAIVEGGSPALFLDTARGLSDDAASRWELRLREAERALGPVSAETPHAAPATVAAVPKLGERRTFNVLKRDLTSRRATAEVKVVTDQTVIYVDLQAPANGLTAEDLARFGAMFDDPIHETGTRVFGAPGDMDANERIIILFTPAVNELTEPNASGLIAGYFYGCDLVPESRCANTNGGEILYSIVPDPTGQFSGVRTRSTVLRTVPGVLAHEFQHMIHFGRRNGSLDALWISEGLAHAAEDVVGEVFLTRGDAVTADDFRRPNLVRTQFFLGEPSLTPLIAETAPGSLEMRGAAWLFMRYLMGHYGGTDVLGRLTAMTGRGVPNIVAATGRAWDEVLGEFGVAIWADDAPELLNTTIDKRFRFADIDVRSMLAVVPGGYSLRPQTLPFSDFQWSGLVASAGEDYILLRAPASAPPAMRLALSGLRGAPLAASTPVQLTILRTR